MHPKHAAPFGTWTSPVTPELVTGASIMLSELAVDGDAVYWLELRPAAGGRTALVRRLPGAEPGDVLPPTADVGTRVHEYGGGAYAVAGGTLVYSERSDGSVWCVEGAAPPRPLVQVAGCRYAGFAIDGARRRVYAVREDHRDRPPSAPENALVAFSLEPGGDPQADAGTPIAGGSDFVAAPQLAPDGTQLAWIAWNHPDMPWDATQLNLAGIGTDGRLTGTRAIAGDGGGEAIAEARFGPDGALIFSSDRSGWWNLYVLRGARIEPLAPAERDFAEPHWVFGRRLIAPLDEQRVLCGYFRDAALQPALVTGGQLRDLPFGPVDTAPLAYGAGAVFIATPPDAAPAICHAPQLSDGACAVLRSAGADALAPGDVSVGEAGTAPTDDGELAHYVLYRPRNAAFCGPPDARPPLLVMSHGGPTSLHRPAFNLGVQWWTSRGFAVAHVNYRGSSGYGRAYRERLRTAWGVVDVLDCIGVARRLAAAGECDAERIAIRGGSASGMTALLAVATSNVFRAAASLYGVMELEALAADTHKFEARYTDGLIGPLPAARERYRERSPVHHVAAIDVPVILFQGLDDRVVPPNQALAMRDALVARGVPVTYHAFAGEGHGFRKAETVQRVLELELDFYRDAFGLRD